MLRTRDFASGRYQYWSYQECPRVPCPFLSCLFCRPPMGRKEWIFLRKPLVSIVLHHMLHGSRDDTLMLSDAHILIRLSPDTEDLPAQGGQEKVTEQSSAGVDPFCVTCTVHVCTLLNLFVLWLAVGSADSDTCGTYDTGQPICDT